MSHAVNPSSSDERPANQRPSAGTSPSTTAAPARESAQPSRPPVKTPATDESPLAERETRAVGRELAKTDTVAETARISVSPKANRASPARAGSVATESGAPASSDDGTQDQIGPYRLLTCIETGKTSQVWEAFSKDGARVAVKLLLPESLKKVEHRRTMSHEFRVGSQFDHPNVIRYLEGYWGTLLRPQSCFSMELFLAPSLKTQLLHDPASVQQRLRRIVETSAAGFAHIHERGFLHRDIKTANLLVNKEGSVRIISFALAGRPTNLLARLLGTRFRTAQGTRSYMAPEQILKRPLSFPVDIYSFGIVLFEMLTGQLPFSAATPNELLMKHIQATPPHPSHLNRKISLRLDRIVLRMLAKKPDQRYPNFGEFLADFQEVHSIG